MSVFVRFLTSGAGGSSSNDPDMQNAYHLCEQYRSDGMNAEWISNKDCLEMKEFTKQDVFVLPKFKGPVYDKLINTKAVVIGPRCLSCCLTEGSEIPPGPNPVYTVAMRNLVITISYLDPSLKEKLGQKIMWMGGKYETMLTEETTHLIAGTVLSEKYIKATTLGIKVMKSEWVDAVWEKSLEKNVSATSPQFNKHKLPVFYNLVLCTTGFSRVEKKELTHLVETHGGTMLKNFETDRIKVLIVEKNATNSEKYKVSQQFDIPCVSGDWIRKSVENGYSIDIKDYTVKTTKTSSPNRPSQLPNMSLDLSVIPNLRSQDHNETCFTTATDITGCNTPMQKEFNKNPKRLNRCGALAKELAQLVDSIEMREVKKAGLFLDGCCIFVYGLTATRREKLHKVVSRAGAVRYDQPVEAVTHAICGDPTTASQSTYKASMPCAIHVTVRWLVDSLHAGKTLEENPYLVFNSEKIGENKKNALTSASPMSKKNLQLLRTPSQQRPPVPLFNLEDKNEEKDEVIQQYIDHKSKFVDDEKDTLEEYVANNQVENDDVTVKENDVSVDKNVSKSDKTLMKADDKQSEAIEMAMSTSEIDNIEEDIFEGIIFELQNIEEASERITQLIIKAGGNVVAPGKGGSYIIVPLDYDEIEIPNDDTKFVTSFWLDDCITKKEVVPVKYYHRPINVSECTKPLEGLVFAMSTYTGVEREFLMELAMLLGANVQASLYRRDSTNSKRTTHLICSEAAGAKYNGAISWGVPVVTSQWLIECLATNKRAPEEPYLLGKSSVTAFNKTGDVTTANKTANVTTNDKTTANVYSNLSNDSNIKNCDANKENNAAGNMVEVDEQLEEVAPNKSCITPTTNNRDKLTRSSSAKLLADNDVDMSPGSRYIAMARQGLLGFESQDSPKRVSEAPRLSSQPNETISTPPIDNALATPNLALFSSTDRRRLLAIKRGERPSNPPKTPTNIFDLSVATPESPFGSALNMPRESRKRLMKFCNELPDPEVKPPERTETPVSELSKKYFSNRLKKTTSSSTIEKPPVARSLDIDNADDPTPPAKQRRLSENSQTTVQQQILQLKSILTGGEGETSSNSTPRSFKGKRSVNNSPAISSTLRVDQFEEEVEIVQTNIMSSQLNTIGWDDMSEMALPTKNTLSLQEPSIKSSTSTESSVTPEPPKIYRFMLSLNVDNGEEIKNIVGRLGGVVIDKNEFDGSATHLLCNKLSRSEKLLGCIAAGKWILHWSYIIRSQEAGLFIDEEAFEWGNPKAKHFCDENDKKLALAVHRWRVNRMENCPPPFASFEVIMHVVESRKGALLRVILAGGGKVVDASVPFKGDIKATHCLVEQRRMGLSKNDLNYLFKRHIPVFAPVYLNTVLIENHPINDKNYVIPEYRELMDD